MFGLTAVYVAQHIALISISVLLAYFVMRIWRVMCNFFKYD
jgi:hypothetical protein